jgi:hypothetical protein
MLLRLADWLDERFEWRNIWEAVFLRKIPHVNWFYTLVRHPVCNVFKLSRAYY